MQFIEFLTEKFNAGTSFSSLNCIRSAVALVLGEKMSSNDCITRFFKGVYRLTPPAPKYSTTWDPNIVLGYLFFIFYFNLFYFVWKTYSYNNLKYIGK